MSINDNCAEMHLVAVFTPEIRGCARKIEAWILDALWKYLQAYKVMKETLRSR